MSAHKYSEYRSQIKSGDLLAWSHGGWGSVHDIKVLGVRAATLSDYSHVGLAWVIGARVLVIEAVEPLVRIYPLSKLGNFYLTPLGAPWLPETEEAALSHVGVEYSQLDAIRAYFEKLDDDCVTECAALVINVLKRDGIDLGPRATPDAVVRAAQRLGNPTYLVEN